MKLAGFTGTGRGKFGNSVFRVRKGEQIISQYQPAVSNPRSLAQMSQRARFKLASQLSAIFADALAGWDASAGVFDKSANRQGFIKHTLSRSYYINDATESAPYGYAGIRFNALALAPTEKSISNVITPTADKFFVTIQSDTRSAVTELQDLDFGVLGMSSLPAGTIIALTSMWALNQPLQVAALADATYPIILAPSIEFGTTYGIDGGQSTAVDSQRIGVMNVATLPVDITRNFTFQFRTNIPAIEQQLSLSVGTLSSSNVRLWVLGYILVPTSSRNLRVRSISSNTTTSTDSATLSLRSLALNSADYDVYSVLPQAIPLRDGQA